MRKVNDLVRQARSEDDEIPLSDKIAELRAPIANANQAVTEYRDDLFKRLPPAYEVFEAGLKDAVDRVKVGVEGYGIARLVKDSVRSWLITGNHTPQQISAVRELFKIGKVSGPSVAGKLEWKKDQRSFTIASTNVSITSENFKDIDAELYEKLNPTESGNELKFKDDDKPAKQKKK